LAETRGRAALWAVGAVALSWGIALASDGDADRARLGGELLVVVGVWLAIARAPQVGPALRQWMPLAVTVAALMLTFVRLRPGEFAPRWALEPLADPAPLDPRLRTLAVYLPSDATATVPRHNLAGFALVARSADLRPGDAWIVSGVETINGYSPIGPAALHGA